MSYTPDAVTMRAYLSAEYGLTMHKVNEILRTPVHPATMRDELAALLLPVAFQNVIDERAGPKRESELMYSWAKRAYEMADAAMVARIATVPKKEDEL